VGSRRQRRHCRRTRRRTPAAGVPAAEAPAAEAPAAGARAAGASAAGATAGAGEAGAVGGDDAATAASAAPMDLERLRTPGEDLLGRVGEHAAAEVAFALHTTRRAATDLLHAAVTLTRRLPLTLRAVERGDVSTRAAVVAAEETCVLDAAAVAAVDEVLVERISAATVPQARERVRRAVVSADPAAAAAREVRARRCRSFDVDRRVVDGMGTFGGYAPIEDVVAIDERVDALARAAKGPGDGRSAGARRMDIVRDLLLGRPVLTADATVAVEPLPARTWKVDVVVAESTLRGADDEPGELSGYGPITAPTARRLAGLAVAGLLGSQRPKQEDVEDDPANDLGSRRGRGGDVGALGPGDVGHCARANAPSDVSSDADAGTDAALGTLPAWPTAVRAVWRRLVTDPLSGIVRDYETTRYRPPTALADLVRARDRYCYAPGCRQVAARCQLDHLKNSPAGPSPRPHPGGVTADHNFGPGCSYHHRVKPRPGWQVTSPRPGVFVWTPPTGHTYTRDAARPLDPPVYDRREPAPPF
jgi:hypothetical protein